MHAVDTTGAGDTFAGVLVASLAGGAEVGDGLRGGECRGIPRRDPPRRRGGHAHPRRDRRGPAGLSALSRRACSRRCRGRRGTDARRARSAPAAA
ncbi:hypothetical protein [Microbacterium hominis]|uniref:hypothetical protein n=1 Tax=Microbacterium hominis TaxID=162426 RepID=UPI0031F370C1